MLCSTEEEQSVSLHTSVRGAAVFICFSLRKKEIALGSLTDPKGRSFAFSRHEKAKKRRKEKAKENGMRNFIILGIFFFENESKTSVVQRTFTGH